MAIEVTKEPPKSILPVEVVCRYCLAELKVTALQDILFRAGTQREPDPDLWVKCPRCQNKVTLPVKGFTKFDLIQIERVNQANSAESYYDK